MTGVAYDIAREVVIRYGGLPMDSNDCIADTWEWDHEAWVEVAATPPTACDHMFLAYDAGRGRTLLFGGGDAAGDLVGETWAWDGQSWELVAAEGPSGRAHFGLAYDEAGEGTLLFGGYDGTAVFGDHWSWDGSSWTELPVDGPSPRSHVGMAVGAGQVLLFGGATGPSTFRSLTDETWSLTEDGWSAVDGPAPPPRGSPALGYDRGRDVFLLYGGFDATGGLLGDTWEWDGAWHCVAGARRRRLAEPVEFRNRIVWALAMPHPDG